jgi:hypothetical protein
MKVGHPTVETQNGQPGHGHYTTGATVFAKVKNLKPPENQA